MKYIKRFESEALYELFKLSEDYITPNVSWCENEYSTKYNPYIPHDYSLDYLTIVSTSDNNVIKWKKTGTAKMISVSIDNGQTWTQYYSSSNDDGTTLATLNNGDKILIKGNNATYGGSYENNQLGATGTFDVEGNIMSMIYGDNFIGQTTLSSDYTFYQLFSPFNNKNVVNACNLILPATTLASYCYLNMFSGCNKLITTPKLPATTLAEGCYSGMFGGCTSLTTAPELPATTLASYCYNHMFSSCRGLTTAPELPVTTLATHCYDYMFYDCTGLTTAPELPATTLVNYCYYSMFRGCTSLTTAPTLPATALTAYCYNCMFHGCTSLTTAPELPATTLASYCYSNMFYGCTNLNYIKCLATNISASNCTYSWVQNVAASGTFVKDPSMTSWTTGNDGIPSGWTVEDYQEVA